jgi:YHS domain-containing protein
MLRFILFLTLFIVLYYILYFLIKDLPPLKKRFKRVSEPEELVQDPYCQKYIPISSALKKRIDRKLFYFCNQDCMKNYVKNYKKLLTN